MITFSYTDILERLQENLKEKLGNSDLLFYSTNQRILEAIAEELQEQMRYDEYLMREAKWDTSQNLSSILNQIDFFNYKPHRKIGTSGTLEISASEDFDVAYPERVVIPKYTEFSSDNLTFCSVEEVELISTITSTNVSIVQGSYRKYTFEITYAYTNQELINLQLDIDNDSIENFNYDLFVNGIKWSEVDHFGYSEGPDDEIYEIRNKNDFSGIELIFGDGLQSKKVEHGDIIEFHCLETEGVDGEILKTNAITNVDSIIRDSSNNIIDLYCRNNEKIGSGDDYETIASIKYNAPRALRLSSRLISKSDYQTFILEQGFGDKVTVWGEAEINIDRNKPIGTFLEFQENLIYISGLNYSIEGLGVPFTDTIQTNIREAIDPIKSVTDLVQFVDPQITYLSFEPSVGYRSDNYSADQVRNAVSNVLFETYNIENARFKEKLYFSQYYELINSLSEVVWHQTVIEMRQYPSWVSPTGDEAGFYFQIELNQTYVFSESVEIYMKNIDADLPTDHPYADWTQIASIDASGAIVGETVPTYSEGTDYDLTDAGDPYSFSHDTGVFNYIQGAFLEDLEVEDPDVLNVKLTNGLWTSASKTNFELKITFNGGTNAEESSTLITNILPRKRNQLFICENVEDFTPVAVSSESEMGY